MCTRPRNADRRPVAQRQAGFTLAEIAIVLVIIGLLLGGVLRASGFIEVVQAHDIVKTVQDLRVGIAGFKSRYNYLPGDWVYSANEINGIVAGGTGGTLGNGIVEGAVSAGGAATAGDEVAVLPAQLYAAGLITKVNVADPTRMITSAFGAIHVVSNAVAVTKVATFVNTTSQNAILINNMTCDAAMEVDGKLDDGSLTTGKGFGNTCTNGKVSFYAIAL